MLGYVYVKGSKLDKIEIKNTKSFKLNGVAVDSYLKTLYFKPVSSGGYLLKEITLEISGKKNNLEYHEIRTTTALEYWDENQNIISFDKGVLTQKIELKDEKYETISLDLDRTFPLLGQEARKSGYVLPKPFGVTLINMYQDTTMHMTSFKVDGLDLDINKIVDGDSTYRSLTYAPLIRADVWVLPFVSFSLIVGKTYTSTEVTLASDSGLDISIPSPGWPIPDINKTIIPPGSQISADIKTNAILYGVGATIAGGFDNYFTTIDFQYIISYTESADVKIDIMAITPIVGYRFNEYNTNLFFGAQYQRLAQSLTFDVTGTAPVIGEKRVKGEIGLLSEEWAGLIGVDYSFTRNWSANFLYSQGIDRKNATLGITYRF
ncbi:MAG: hypothetical protein U9N39_02330 [Campylobacterota bacterium]|nr:hypothetical protein [Campylobacterota bacterium]